MSKKWYCSFCREERKYFVAQCFCGNWQNDSCRESFEKSNPIRKCFDILEKHFGYPAELVTEADYFELKQVVNNEVHKHHNENIKRALKGYIIWLLERLEIPTGKNIINVYFKDDNERIHGQYSSNNYMGYNTIDVGLTKEDTVESMLYIATHEVMHCFLDYHNVKLASDKANEVLADLSVIYFGFGQVFEEGREIKTESRFVENGIVNDYRKYGYLSDSQMDMATQLYNKRRLQFKNNKAIIENNLDMLGNEIKSTKSFFEKLIFDDDYDEYDEKIQDIASQFMEKINNNNKIIEDYKKRLETINKKADFNELNNDILDCFEDFSSYNTTQESQSNIKKHKVKKIRRILFTKAVEFTD